MAETAKKKYRKNYLTQVVYQITFDGRDALNARLLKKYSDSLGPDYAGLAKITRQAAVFQTSGNTGISAEDIVIWQIASRDGDHTVEITRNSFDISFTKYILYRDFAPIITNAQNKFRELVPDLQRINRLGLRYVNQINLDTGNLRWEEYIDSSIAGFLSFTDTSKIRRSMHNIVLAEDDETMLNINYGIFNRRFPEPITENEFILDLDAYTPAAVDIEDTLRLLKKFNTTNAIYFENSVTDKLRAVMGVIEEQPA
jgi:uncharacterized protein (TIGR04255 family)